MKIVYCGTELKSLVLNVLNARIPEASIRK